MSNTEANSNAAHFEEKARDAHAAHIEAVEQHEDALRERESGPYKVFIDAEARLDTLYAQIEEQERVVRDSDAQFRTGASDGSDETFRKLEDLLSAKRQAEDRLRVLRAMLEPVERGLVEQCLAASHAIDRVNETAAAVQKARAEDVAYGVLARFSAVLEQAVSVGGYAILRQALDAMPGAPDQSPEALELAALHRGMLTQADVHALTRGGRVPPGLAVLIRRLLDGDATVAGMLRHRRLTSALADRALRGICERALKPATAQETP
ncbi:hypothetical protein [Paraburkholderia bryophila]|uniref:Uncharacterized protein n=1 Tax=Paraburkholderia bryophila TaxID=420952 RepID=A0A329CE65_9BURK|nr:hypothetical protein [Paraburkholderia bryophila]RAS32042.1 hypothetical protein BX591_108149 [Paraburkholderia bryophila]